MTDTQVENWTTESAAPRGTLAPEGPFVATHHGMPVVDISAPRYPLFKLWATEPIFYIPAVFMWLALSFRYCSFTLPSSANPGMEAGGLWGESKAQGQEMFGHYARKWLARWVLVERKSNSAAECEIQRAIESMRAADLSFPVVAKPDVGYQGWGVQKLCDVAELSAYVGAFPLGGSFLLQRLVPHLGEAGVFYVRWPGEHRGQIISMALTYSPYVVGDGVSTLGELVSSDPILKKNKNTYFACHAESQNWIPGLHEPVRLSFCASARMGSVYRDARHLVTPALTARFDAISQDIEGFYFGRFDVRFSSIDQFLDGNDFSIVELNGAGAEVLHIWDGRFRTMDAYRALWRQYKMAFEMGAANKRLGHRPESLGGMIKRQRLQHRLRKIYPMTN